MSSPTAERMNPSRIETSDLSGLPPPRPTKLEKVRSWIAKNSGGPKLSAISARSGAKNVISTIEKSAPTKDDVNAAMRAWPPCPCRASGYPSNVVAGDRHLEAEKEVLDPHRLLPEPRLERALGHRHEEPLLEDEERREREEDGDRQHGGPGVPTDPAHVEAGVECRRDVEPEPQR